jgi:hypothetical protein
MNVCVVAGLAQGVCDELEERASGWWADLDRLRRRAVDLACSDASAVVEQAALEVIRTQVSRQIPASSAQRVGALVC